MPKGESPSVGERTEPVQQDAKKLLREAGRALMVDALRTKEGIAGLRAWRDLDHGGPAARRMRVFFDRMSAADRAMKTRPDQQAAIKQSLKQSVSARSETTKQSSSESFRLDEFQSLFLSEKFGDPLPPARPEVKKIFDGLRTARSTEGAVNVAELLTSGQAAFGAKAQWFSAQLESALKFLERRDLADARAKAEETVSSEHITASTPPPDEDSFAPSMEEMERSKEGEPGAYFTIAPFYGGYYRQGDYDRWNAQKLKWERSEPRKFQPPAEQVVSTEGRRVMTGTVRGGEVTALPMPYGWAPDVDALRHADGVKLSVLEDGRGGYAVVEGAGKGNAAFSVEIGRTPPLSSPRSERGSSLDSHFRGNDKKDATIQQSIETGRLSNETETFLSQTKSSGKPALEQARALKAFVRRTLKYSNDSAMNAVYRGGDPAGYFSRIEGGKKADCDVANTYYAALLSRLEIPSRMVTGHYVKSKDRAGAAVISGGTGHAWVEAFSDGKWHRFDATPPGDPTMDDEEADEKPDEAFEGDFGEQDAVSEAELEQMIKEAGAAIEKKERSVEEQAAEAFSGEAGCTPEEAKEILKEMEGARDVRDKEGRRIRDLIVREFQKVVQENLVERLRYKAPVRMSAGTALEEPVEAALDMRAGDADPTGFGRHERKTEREQIYGGMDVVFVADQSGSMAENEKWKEQQKLIFLAIEALHVAASEFKRNRIKLMSPVDIRAGLVIFKAGGAAVKLPLGGDWGPKEQFAVWKSLKENVSGGTPDHLGMQTAAAMMRSGRKSGEKGRIQVVLEYSDGGSDDPAAFAGEIAALRADGVVADAYRQDLVGLPSWVSARIIEAARKLNPRKVRK